MAVSLQSRYLMGSTLAVLMVGIGFLAVAQFLGRAGAAVTERRSLDLAQQTLDRALSDLKDAETGQRGFLLTGHETYLTPYEHGRREALEKLETLQQLPGARALDPGALRRLDDLSRLKLAELARTIALAQGGRRAEALALVDTGEGLRTMDEIRAEEASMAEVLQRRRETQVASLAEASRWLRWALACTGLLSLTSLGLGAWGLHRDNRLRLAAERSLVASEARLHQMVDGIRDYAVLMLDPQGRVISWNAGAARIKGYEAREILGRDFSCFYTPEEVAAGGPARMLREALENGRAEEEGWRVRKDGSRFWADVVISALQDARGEPLGFVKVTQDLSERRRAEEDLRASERRFRTLAEAAPVGIFEMDAEGHRPYINDALCALAGLDYEEASAVGFRHRIHPEDLDRVLRHWERVHAQGGESFLEYRFVLPDGRVRWVESRAAPIPGVDGQPGSHIGIVVDRTEQRQVQEDLKASERRFRALAESASDAIVSTNQLGEIVYWNPAAESIFGHAAAEALGQPVSLIVPQGFRAAHTAGMARYLATGEAHVIGRIVELEGLHKDGHTFPLELSLSAWEQGSERYFTALIRDTTTRTQLEREARAREAQAAVEADRAVSYHQLEELKAALDEHAIVAITDAQGKITYVNDKFCAISKFARRELLGRDHRIINSGHHPKAFIKDLWDTITAGKVWKGEIKNRAKDGSHYWVDTTIVPFLGPDRKPAQYIAIRADITDRKAAEESVRVLNDELEARVALRTQEIEAVNKELESFAYSVSHDLRAPLRHIDGFVGLLRRSLGEQVDTRAGHQLDVISASARQMGALIDDLLTFSRMGRTEVHKTVFDLEALARRVVEDLAPDAAGRLVEWRIQDLPAVQGDPALLRLVLLNLIGNALKFTRGRSPARIEISAKDGEGLTAVTVRDNGAGFDMRYADKLFGVFQRLHRQEEFEGTGIGLANAARIIHKHGGAVSAEGAVGSGAAFTFTLPAP